MVLLLAILAPSCEPAVDPVRPDPTSKPVAASVDDLLGEIATLSPEAVVQGLLDRCHSVLKGGQKLANSVVELREHPTDESCEQILLGSDRAMKVRSPDRSHRVVVRGHGWHLVPTEGGGETIETVEGEALARLQSFQTLVRAALLAPLYTFAEVTRQGPTVFALILPGGETWRLEIGPVQPPEGAAILLPKNLSGPAGKVEFLEYLHTGVTHLPQRIILGAFGERSFALKLSGLVYDPQVFTNPHLQPQAGKTLVKTQAASAYPPKNKPTLTTVPSRTCLVVADPGDWPGRFETLAARGGELGAQGQQNAGLDFLFEEDGDAFLAMPFEMAELEHGGRPFAARAGQKVVRLPAQEIVLVYPDNGSLESCRAAAEKILDRFVAENELTPAGPLRMVPWIEVEDGVPKPRVLQNLRVGFELPVRR